MPTPFSENDLSLEEAFLHSYPADILDDIFQIHFREFLQTTPHFFTEWNLNRKDYEGLTLRKRDIVRVMAITFSDAHLFDAWFKQLPYLVSRVFESIIWEGRQAVIDLNQRTKGDILQNIEPEAIAYDTLNPDYCIFVLCTSAWVPPGKEKTIYFDLPGPLKKRSRVYLPKPRGYELKPLKTTEPTAYLFADNEAILESMQVCIRFIREGALDTTKGGEIRKQSLTRLQQQTGLSEFFPESSEKSLRLLRIHLIASALNAFNPEVVPESPMELIRAIIQSYEACDSEPLLVPFMDWIKGWYHAARYLKPQCQAELTELLRAMPVNRWISMKQIRRYIQVRDIDISPVEELGLQYLYVTGNWKGWGNRKEMIAPEQLQDRVIDPFLSMNLFLLAAFGCFNLKYNAPGLPSGESPGASISRVLQYVQLTELGAHLLGIQDAYTPSCPRGADVSLDMDQDRLIVTLSHPDPVKEAVLEEMSQRIGPRRFKFDHDVFLKNCQTRSDVLKKIDRLHEFAGPDLPENWQRFLQDILKKSNAIQLTRDRIVLSIDDKDAQLIELFSEDPVLRELVSLSENFQVVIEEKSLPSLKRRLRIFGYLF